MGMLHGYCPIYLRLAMFAKSYINKSGIYVHVCIFLSTYL